MQDVFIEYMVRKRNPPATILLKILIALAGGLIMLIAIGASAFLGPFSFIGLLVGVGAIYGAYLLISSMSVEYEYSVTNGELDVDKITAQRKRRRLISVNCREVEAFGKYKPQEHANKTYQNKILACDHPDSEGLWYCVSRQKDKGLTLLVFNANDRMLNGIKTFLPRPIMHEAFRIGS